MPYDADACTLKNTTKWNTFFNPLPASDVRHKRESCLSSDKGIVSDAHTSISQKTWTSLFKNSSESNVIQNEKEDASTCLPQKTWSSSDCDGLGKDEVFWTEALNSCPPLDKSTTEFWSSGMPCSKRVSNESEGNMLDSSQHSENVDNWETNWDEQGAAVDASQCFEELKNWELDRDICSSLTEVISITDNTLAGGTRHEDGCFKLISSDLNTQHSEEVNIVLNLEGNETQPSDSDCSAVIYEANLEENHDNDASHSSFSSGAQIEIACSPVADINGAPSSSVIHSVVVKVNENVLWSYHFCLYKSSEMFC